MTNSCSLLRKPNILILMPDTWRGDTLGCSGHPAVKTPNLDRLASMGVRFEKAYSSSPVCMPARSNCMSGWYCHNTGQWHNHGRFPLHAPTYMRHLQENGYRTAHIGKSHFYPHSNARVENPPHLDSEKGYIHAMGHDDVLETTGPLATVGCNSIMTDEWNEKGLTDVFRADYCERNKQGPFNAFWPSPLDEKDHMDSFVGRTAIDYFKNRDKSQPFAAFVGFPGPHDPWDPPAVWADMYADVAVPEPLPPSPPDSWLSEAARTYHNRLMDEPKDQDTWQAMRRLYYAKCSHVDSLIGDLLDTLEEQGELDNTVIVFWSDHGDRLCDRGKYAKGVFFDESARIPIILRLPGNPGAGGVCNSVVSINDIFPTILEAAGIEGVDSFGESLLPAIEDPDQPLHDAVFSEISGQSGLLTMLRNNRYKMIIKNDSTTLQLFDMVQDPNELANLAGRADMAAIEQELKRKIFQWRLKTDIPQGQGDGPRPLDKA